VSFGSGGPPDPPEEGDERLRLLALWHSRRRELDDLVEPLLLHGPAAVGRVDGRIGEITVAVRSEMAAFEALCEALALHRAAPDVADDDLGLLRQRADRARSLARQRLQPGLLSDLERLREEQQADTAADPLWNVRPLHRDGDR
jgi:hypothetical protein